MSVAGGASAPSPASAIDTGTAPATAVVIDTNVVLDLLLFGDASTQALEQALLSGALVWLGTGAMREELQRVLAYPVMQSAMRQRGRTAGPMMLRFDQLCRLQPDAARCAVRCTDADDQIFIDLAVAHRALLLSKDRAVLRLRKRLARLGVPAQTTFSQATGNCRRAPAARTGGRSAAG